MLRRIPRLRLTIKSLALLLAAIAGLLAWYRSPVPQTKVVQIYIPSGCFGRHLHRHESFTVIRQPFGQPQRHGLCETHNGAGRLIERTNWRLGVLHGKHESWHDSGELAALGQWKSGQPDGIWFFWRETPDSFEEIYPQLLCLPLSYLDEWQSPPSQRWHFENGQLVQAIGYAADRVITADRHPVNRTVRLQVETNSGQFISETNWKLAGDEYIPHGPTRHRNGVQGIWHEGIPVGTWICRPHGQQEHTLEYVDGHIVRIDGQPYDSFTKYVHKARAEDALTSTTEILAKCRRPMSNTFMEYGTENVSYVFGGSQFQFNSLILQIGWSATPVFEKEDEALAAENYEGLAHGEPGQAALLEMDHVPPNRHTEDISDDVITMQCAPVDATLCMWLQKKGLTLRFSGWALTIVTPKVGKRLDEDPDASTFWLDDYRAAMDVDEEP